MNWIQKIGAMAIVLPIVTSYSPNGDMGAEGLALTQDGQCVFFQISEGRPEHEDSVKKNFYAGSDFYCELPYEPKHHFFYAKSYSGYGIIFENDIVICIQSGYIGDRYYNKAVTQKISPMDMQTVLWRLREKFFDVEFDTENGILSHLISHSDPKQTPETYELYETFRAELNRISEIIEHSNEPLLNFSVNANGINFQFFNVRPEDLQACLKSVGSLKLINYDKYEHNKE